MLNIFISLAVKCQEASQDTSKRALLYNNKGQGTTPVFGVFARGAQKFRINAFIEMQAHCVMALNRTTEMDFHHSVVAHGALNVSFQAKLSD